MAERLQVAFALHGELGQVHGARGVDGQHDLGVDLDGRGVLGGGEACGEERSGDEACEQSTGHGSPPGFG